MKLWAMLASAGYVLASCTPSAWAEDVRVFILAGQSNALGYGQEAALAPSLVSQTDVLYDFWNTTARLPGGDYASSVSTEWGPLEPKALQPGGARRFGPEISFGRTVADASPGTRVAILKASGQGTTILEHWERGLPPDARYPEKSQLYHTLFGSLDSATYPTLAYPSEPTRLDAALSRLEARGDTYQIAGFIWLQGENEAAWSAAFTYEEHLRSFVDAVREDLASPQLPFVIARLSLNGSASEGGPLPDAGVLAVRDAQASLAATDEHVALVDIDDLPPETPGGFHFTSEGYLTIGARLGEAYLALGSGAGGGSPTTTSGAGGAGGSTTGAGGSGGAGGVDDAEALEDGCRASPTSPSHGAGYLLLALAALFGGLRRWGRATARPPLRSRTSSSLGDAPGP